MTASTDREVRTEDDVLDGIEDRHRARVAALSSVGGAEDDLRRALAPPTPPPPKRFFRRLGRIFRAPSPPVLAGAAHAAARHEAALTALRALAFQLRALESAIDATLRDHETAHHVARQPEQEEHGELSPWQQDVNTHHQDIYIARAEDLALLLNETVDHLKGQHHALRTLHEAATGAVGALAREAIATDTGAGRGVNEDEITDVVRLAGECAAEVHHRVDTLAQRLSELDAEAEARRAARDEVERLLGSPCDAP